MDLSPSDTFLSVCNESPESHGELVRASLSSKLPADSSSRYSLRFIAAPSLDRFIPTQLVRVESHPWANQLLREWKQKLKPQKTVNRAHFELIRLELRTKRLIKLSIRLRKRRRAMKLESKMCIMVTLNPETSRQKLALRNESGAYDDVGSHIVDWRTVREGPAN